MENLGLCHFLSIIERNCFHYSYRRLVESPYTIKPLPSIAPMPMYFFGDPYKVDISKEEGTYR